MTSAIAAAGTASSTRPPSSGPVPAHGQGDERFLALQPGEVVYFAYGANMSPAVLARRKVSPRVSVPCEVPVHYLSFRQKGRHVLEPAFACLLPRHGAAHSPESAALAPDSIYNSLRRDGQVCEHLGPDVHGVLHILSAADWSSIMRAEGVGLSAAAGYQVVVVNCVTYSGRSVPAYTLQSHPSSLHSPDAAVVPSHRYMSILREGALHFGCKPAFVDYLQSLPCLPPVK